MAAAVAAAGPLAAVLLALTAVLVLATVITVAAWAATLVAVLAVIAPASAGAIVVTTHLAGLSAVTEVGARMDAPGPEVAGVVAVVDGFGVHGRLTNPQVVVVFHTTLPLLPAGSALGWGGSRSNLGTLGSSRRRLVNLCCSHSFRGHLGLLGPGLGVERPIGEAAEGPVAAALLVKDVTARALAAQELLHLEEVEGVACACVGLKPVGILVAQLLGHHDAAGVAVGVKVQAGLDAGVHCRVAGRLDVELQGGLIAVVAVLVVDLNMREHPACGLKANNDVLDAAKLVV